MANWKIGDRVFVVADNYGSEGVVVETREGDLPCKVRTATDEFWAAPYEVHPREDDMAKDQNWGDVFNRLVAAGYDHAYAADRADQKFPQPKREISQAKKDTLEHIEKVRGRIDEVCRHLQSRANVHDASKLQEPEKSGYDVLTVKLADCVYGSDEYKAALAEAKDTITHHYAHNSHHPEHYPDGIAGMSLLDVVEMLCDWKAASERTKQGSIAQSLTHNKQRFGISDQLAQILENTVKELRW